MAARATEQGMGLKMKSRLIFSSTLLMCCFAASCAPVVDFSPEYNEFRVAQSAGSRGTLFIRAFEKRQDIPATCQVMGRGYSTTVTTPASVDVPIFGSGSEEVKYTCTYMGEIRTSSAKLIDVTQHQIDSLAGCENPNRALAPIGGVLVSTPSSTCTGMWREQLKELRAIPTSEHRVDYSTPGLNF